MSVVDSAPGPRPTWVAVLAATLALTTGVTVSAALAGSAHATPGKLYGDPQAAAPFWRYQEFDDDCVEQAVADVVGQLTGDEPTERAVVRLAQNTPSPSHSGPIYVKPGKRHHGEGTSFDDGPALLAHYGVHAASVYNISMETLEQDLANGRKVIAGVNAETLWGEPAEDKDDNGQPLSNHAVVVTGVDTATGMVHLNDSGSENGRDEQVTIKTFTRSWASSDEQMTVTG
jgi:Peptidase_C39 like family